jgi:hypothetical protein
MALFVSLCVQTRKELEQQNREQLERKEALEQARFSSPALVTFVPTDHDPRADLHIFSVCIPLNCA